MRYWIGSTTKQALDCLGPLLKSITVASDALEDGPKQSHNSFSEELQGGADSGKEDAPHSEPSASVYDTVTGDCTEAVLRPPTPPPPPLSPHGVHPHLHPLQSEVERGRSRRQ